VSLLDKLEKDFDVDSIRRELTARGYTEDDSERTLLKVAAVVQREALGGRADFTGETRVYRNGAIGFRVRCKKCKGLYWVTEMPYALCPDCDPKHMFR
jgi:hypothetical protein